MGGSCLSAFTACPGRGHYHRGKQSLVSFSLAQGRWKWVSLPLLTRGKMGENRKEEMGGGEEGKGEGQAQVS